MVLHEVKEAEITQKEINSECRTLAYTGIILTILSLVMVKFLHYRNKNSSDLWQKQMKEYTF